ncbi:MAG: hypothetical protein ABR551_07545 [Gemmatimonadales bacterium]
MQQPDLFTMVGRLILLRRIPELVEIPMSNVHSRYTARLHVRKQRWYKVEPPLVKILMLLW